MTEGTGQGASAADRALTLAAVLLVTAWLGWIQMSFAGLYDLDSYFHVRAAEQLAAHGVAKTFPQATQSTWRDAYSDKDFLFHVLSIPFVTGDDPFEGGKWCVIALQLLVLASFAFALRSFDLVATMTSGGPYGSSNVLAFYMYEQSIGNYRVGYGAAIATVLFLIMLVYISFFLWRMLRTEK